MILSLIQETRNLFSVSESFSKLFKTNIYKREVQVSFFYVVCMFTRVPVYLIRIFNFAARQLTGFTNNPDYKKILSLDRHESDVCISRLWYTTDNDKYDGHKKK